MVVKLLCEGRSPASDKIKILGVDNRELPPLQEDECFSMQKITYSRGSFERLFRDHHFDVVLNLGRFSHTLVDAPGELARKLEFSVIGTQRILDLSLKHGVKKVVTLSTFHVYGALSDNSAYLDEEMPLRASLKYPELRHVVEMDNVTSNWMWRHQNNIQCVMFRPCNIIGEKSRNTMSRYLVYPYAPYPMDYNPMLQFIHESDMAKLIVFSCEHIPTGIYNVAPDGAISLRQALETTGNLNIPAPFFLGKLLVRMLKWPFFRIPNYLIDYLMYSCLIDSAALRKHLPGDFFRFSVEEALRSLRPPRQD